jgi:hypothetical protein
MLQASEMTIRWTGFQRNREAVVLGNPSDIAFYQYAVGMVNKQEKLPHMMNLNHVEVNKREKLPHMMNLNHVEVNMW